jgi:xanthine dehydrogenase/oxidase
MIINLFLKKSLNFNLFMQLCKNCPSACCKQEIEDSVLCNVSSEILIEVKSGEIWAKAKTLSNVYAALSRFSQGRMKYRIVGGNTGTGVYKDDGPFFAFIDINSVPDLKNVTMNTSRVQLGASVTLASAIDLLQRASQLEGYAYTAQISKHLKRVANTPVRNV